MQGGGRQRSMSPVSIWKREHPGEHQLWGVQQMTAIAQKMLSRSSNEGTTWRGSRRLGGNVCSRPCCCWRDRRLAAVECSANNSTVSCCSACLQIWSVTRAAAIACWSAKLPENSSGESTRCRLMG